MSERAEGVSAVTGIAAAAYDGVSTSELTRRLGVPRVASYVDVGSTMDVAHALASEGAPAGTVVLADRQSAGRGRNGRQWVSPGGSGIRLTLIERPPDVSGIDVLAVRLGLHAAQALDRHAGGPVGLKWPNDLCRGGRKLAGVLVEAQWQEGRLLWVAVGIGVNVRTPDAGLDAVGLAEGATRVDVLGDLIPALRAAAAERGPLTPGELAQFADRDVARGRSCREPGPGLVEGIAATGELLVSYHGATRRYRAGSLVLDAPPGGS